MVRTLTLILLGSIWIMLGGCVQVVGYEGDYRGRVIDADTGQPVSGVVVLGGLV